MSVKVASGRALDADVIVAGTGPGGSAAATVLARAGVRVIALDRQRFPRDKVCGGFVGPVGLREWGHRGTGYPVARSRRPGGDQGTKLAHRSRPSHGRDGFAIHIRSGEESA